MIWGTTGEGGAQVFLHVATIAIHHAELLQLSGRAVMDTRECWDVNAHAEAQTHEYAPASRRVWDGTANAHEDRHSYSTEKCDLQTLPFARRRKTGQNNRDRLRWFLQLNTHTETSTLKLLTERCAGHTSSYYCNYHLYVIFTKKVIGKVWNDKNKM